MNILHVSTPLSWRGGEQQALYLTYAYREKGIAQVVLCPKDSVFATRLLEEEIPMTTFVSRGFLGLKLAKNISQLCKDYKFTHIHCHDSHGHSAAVLSSSISDHKASIIISRRVAFPVSKNPFSLWKYNHGSIKRIICVSKEIMRITLPSIKNSEKVCVVLDGIDLNKFKRTSKTRRLITELGLDESSILIGNLSALSSAKDFPTFLKVAAAVTAKNANTKFIIAGEGPEEENIKKIIHDLKLQDKVFLLGFRTDVIEIMHSLDILLFTSSVEGLGTTILDAYSAGVPVVATRGGGIPEIIDHKSSGLLREVGDVDSLTEDVLLLIKDQDFKNKIIQGALNKVKSFSYQNMAEKTLAFYHDSIE